MSNHGYPADDSHRYRVAFWAAIAAWLVLGGCAVGLLVGGLR